MKSELWVFEPTESGCHEWRGALSKYGYGPHRAAYIRAKGSIPEGLQLDHLCRNRRCVNPEHLEPVTKAENLRRARAAKTMCKRGHPWTPENIHAPRRGNRECLTCLKDRERRKYDPRRLHATWPPVACGRGHSFAEPTNLYYDSRGRRQCRPCTMERARNRYRALAGIAS